MPGGRGGKYEAIFSESLELARRESLVLQEGGLCSLPVRWADNEPRIPRGSIVHCRRVSAGLLRPGVFVVCRNRGELVVRRVVQRFAEERETFVVLQALAQPAPEPPVPATALLGIVTEVEHGGRRWKPHRASLRWRSRTLWGGLVESFRRVVGRLPVRHRHLPADDGG